MGHVIAAGTATAPRAAVLDERHVAERALRVARPTALGVLGDPERAADVAQEVALVALRRRTASRDPAALDAWLHRIAVRAALREGRAAGRRRAAEARAAAAARPAGQALASAAPTPWPCWPACRPVSAPP